MSFGFLVRNRLITTTTIFCYICWCNPFDDFLQNVDIIGNSKKFSSSSSSSRPSSVSAESIAVDSESINREDSSKFYELVVQDDGRRFVDKSLLIEDYLRRWGNKILISRPRQWGKSVNIDMLRRYLEIELDDNGEPLLEDRRIYRKLFLGGEIRSGDQMKTLKPLNIVKYEFIAKRQGEFPVIYLSFAELTGSNYRQFEDNVRLYIGRLFERYRYVRESLTDDDKIVYDLFASSSSCSSNVTVDLLRKSVQTLSRMLERRFNRKVHILVDDYDAPLRNCLNDFLTNNNNNNNDNINNNNNNNSNDSNDNTIERAMKVVLFESEDYERIVLLMAKILGNVLNFNSALEMAFLTGQLPLADTPMARHFVGTGLDDYSFRKKPFAVYYGFSKLEIHELMLKLSAKKLHRAVKFWYKGYNMADSTVYNPYSVMLALKNGRCDDYWVRAGDLGYAEHFLRRPYVQSKLETLLTLRALEIPSVDDVQPIGFNYLVHDDVIRYLWMTGYLTQIPPRNKKCIDNSRRSSKSIVLKIPNYELQTLFVERIIEFNAKQYNLTSDDLRNGTKLLYKGFVREFKTWLASNFQI